MKLAYFKRELQELLVLYTYIIPLKSFEKLFVQRYARNLDLQSFGVDSLEALFQKVVTNVPPQKTYTAVHVLSSKCSD